MQGFIRAIARLFVMGAVVGAVVVGGLFAGFGTTTAAAMGLVLAGAVGLVGFARRPRGLSGAQEIEAMLAADPLDGRKPAAVPAHATAHAPSLVEATRVDSMAPQRETPLDPEANMPRWRRPSLLEARRSDPTRRSPVQHVPMRFGEDPSNEADIRVVRYAVAPVLDRPDEVLGLRLTDLGAGDEVEVLAAHGAFLEIVCPNGDRGYVHRTTLGLRGPIDIQDEMRQMPQEADDALTALLSARGLI